MYQCTNCGAYVEDIAYVNGWIECYDCSGKHQDQPAYIVFPEGSDGDSNEYESHESPADDNEKPDIDPDQPDWDAPEYWLLTDEDRDFNRNN